MRSKGKLFMCVLDDSSCCPRVFSSFSECFFSFFDKIDAIVEIAQKLQAWREKPKTERAEIIIRFTWGSLQGWPGPGKLRTEF